MRFIHVDIDKCVDSLFTALWHLFLWIHHTLALLLWLLDIWVGGSYYTHFATVYTPILSLGAHGQECLHGINLGVGWPICRAHIALSALLDDQLFTKVIVPVYTPISSVQDSLLYHSLAYPWYCHIKKFFFWVCQKLSLYLFVSNQYSNKTHRVQYGSTVTIQLYCLI